MMQTYTRCSKCPKRGGTCFCPGCNAYFCDDDFLTHRGMLIDQLDELTVQRNELQAKLHEIPSSRHTEEFIMTQIDEWQRITIEKVNQAAKLAKQQVVTIMNSKREEISTRFEALSKELLKRRDEKTVLENDIARLKTKINQLNQDLSKLTQTPTIKLNTNESDGIRWNEIIYAEEKSAPAGNQSRQSKSVGRKP